MKKIMIAAFETAENTYENYFAALEKLGAEGFMSLEPADMENADGLILPGSSQDMNPKLWGEEDQCSNDINDELDEAQWEILDAAIAQRKPVLGICRGMQFINVYFGGTLIQNLTEADAHKAAEDGQPDNYHMVFNSDGKFMKELFGSLSNVNTRHHQGVGRLGDEMEVAALWVSDFGFPTPEAICHKELPITGVQWHPERMFILDGEEDGGKLMAHCLGL